MRILYLSQYFPPEAGATQTRAYEMASNWIKLGHSVTMLTEFPNHPSGIIPPQYKRKLFERSVLDGIDVIRVWVKASAVKNFRSRMFFYLSYMVNAFLAGIIFARGRYDLIYATSPPLFVGGAALLLSYFKHIPMVFEVRDLWPESAVALGELSNPRAINWSTKLEEACYRRAIQVIVVTRGAYYRLIERGFSPEKLFVSPNGTNIDMFKFNFLERDRLRKELGLDNKFVAIYAGIHGLAQGLETILQAASILKNVENIHFLLIGDGPKKAEILSLSKEYQLKNLSLLPEKPHDQIPGYLSASDIALVPLKKAEVFKGVIPSKIFDAWGCERPVIISIDGEARELVESINGGLFVPPEDPDKMAEALIKFMNSPEELSIMGKNGFAYTKQNNSRKVLAELLINHLENLINK